MLTPFQQSIVDTYSLYLHDVSKYTNNKSYYNKYKSINYRLYKFSDVNTYLVSLDTNQDTPYLYNVKAKRYRPLSYIIFQKGIMYVVYFSNAKTIYIPVKI